jgi:hypothetical protein
MRYSRCPDIHHTLRYSNRPRRRPGAVKPGPLSPRPWRRPGPRAAVLRVDFAKVHMPIADQQLGGDTLDPHSLSGQRPAHEPSPSALLQQALRVQPAHFAAAGIVPLPRGVPNRAEDWGDRPRPVAASSLLDAQLRQRVQAHRVPAVVIHDRQRVALRLRQRVFPLAVHLPQLVGCRALEAPGRRRASSRFTREVCNAGGSPNKIPDKSEMPGRSMRTEKTSVNQHVRLFSRLALALGNTKSAGVKKPTPLWNQKGRMIRTPSFPVGPSAGA